MEVIYSKYFLKDFKKLPKEIQDKFEKRLSIFIEDHYNSVLNIHGLRGAFAGKYSFNVTADYRVIFAYESDGVVVFITIDTHSNLYR